MAQEPKVNKGTYDERAKARNKKFAQEVYARGVVNYEMRTGKMQKAPCEICGELKVEAHHDDYNKPKEVRWFCPRHHKEWHKYNQPIRMRAESRKTFCRWCNREFIKQTKNHSYCSKQCAIMGRRQRNEECRSRNGWKWKTYVKKRQPVEPKELVCLWCHQPFMALTRTIRYCSDGCRRQARLQQKREEYFRNKEHYAQNFKKYKQRLKENGIN